MAVDDPPERLLILYATETGNALDVAERVGREAGRLGCPVAIFSTDDFDAVGKKEIWLLCSLLV